MQPLDMRDYTECSISVLVGQQFVMVIANIIGNHLETPVDSINKEVAAQVRTFGAVVEDMVNHLG